MSGKLLDAFAPGYRVQAGRAFQVVASSKVPVIANTACSGISGDTEKVFVQIGQAHHFDQETGCAVAAGHVPGDLFCLIAPLGHLVYPEVVG